MVEVGLFALSTFLFLLVAAYSFLSGALHLALLVGRVSHGADARPNWLVLANAAWVPVAVLAFVLDRAGWTPDESIEFFLAVALLIALFVALTLPSTIPVVRAYLVHQSNGRALALSVVALFVTPWNAAILMTLGTMLFAQFEPANYKAVWTLDADEPKCQTALMNTLGFRRWQEIGEVKDDVVNMIPAGVQFWLDNAMKAALLDGPEVFGCNVTQLRHSRDSWSAMISVFWFRTLISVVILSVLGVAFFQIVASLRQRLSATM